MRSTQYSIEYRGKIFFTNSATAGSSTVFTNNGGAGFNEIGGSTEFFDTSSAANGTFINNAGVADAAEGGFTEFHNNSTAANGTFTNNGGDGQSNHFGGITLFRDTSTAGNGVFINNGGTIVPGTTSIIDHASAGNGTFTNNGAPASGARPGTTFINATASNGTFINNGGLANGAHGGATICLGTAANGTFINNGATVDGAQGGFTEFLFASTAGNATLIADGGSNGGGGGTIVFADQSTPGTARIEVFGNGSLDISLHDAPGMTINSIEGDGNVFLAANNLTVGSDNVSTTFACAIQDGGQGGGVGGSLTKVGTGTLILSAVNTYSGVTTVRRGVLQVDGSINSNTSVHHNGTLAGTGTIHGNVTNNNGGTVSPGDGPGVLTVVQNYTQTQFATLMIQIAGSTTGQFSVLDVLENASLNGYLDPVLLNGFVPTIGQTFTFLDYGSLTGGFSHIKHQVFDNGMLPWSVIYQNNSAILTVGPNTIPDQGSTFLLLTLGFLGLMAYRRTIFVADAHRDDGVSLCVRMRS